LQGGGHPHMNRRHLLALAAAAVTQPLAAAAQQKTIPVIGYLSTATRSQTAPYLAAIHQALAEAGYVESQSFTTEYRWAEGHYERLPALAADLVARKVDVIVTGGGAPSALAAKGATSTIPIAFVSADPIADGLVAGLSRPHGNLTGVSLLSSELMAKRFELLSDLVPVNSLIVLLVNPMNPSTQRVIAEAQEVSRTKGMSLSILKARNEDEIESAFAALVDLHAGALVLQADAFFTVQRDRLIASAERRAVPAIYYFRDFVAFGGLISYGASVTGSYHQLGVYVGKILNGAKPADLPVQQPTTFELVINLKTAKALGLTVPQSVLVRADEVIE
jgi:ABC-type uncharacterized transport system substrate-binding protein